MFSVLFKITLFKTFDPAIYIYIHIYIFIILYTFTKLVDKFTRLADSGYLQK